MRQVVAAIQVAFLKLANRRLEAYEAVLRLASAPGCPAKESVPGMASGTEQTAGGRYGGDK